MVFEALRILSDQEYFYSLTSRPPFPNLEKLPALISSVASRYSDGELEALWKSDRESPTSKLSRQSNGRSNPKVVGSIPTEVKDFFFTSCGSVIPFTRANPQWPIHGFN